MEAFSPCSPYFPTFVHPQSSNGSHPLVLEGMRQQLPPWLTTRNTLGCHCGSQAFLSSTPCAACTREQHGRSARSAARAGASDIQRLEAAAISMVVAADNLDAVFNVTDVNALAGVSTTPRNGGPGATSSTKTNSSRAYDVLLGHQKKMDRPRFLVGWGRRMCLYDCEDALGANLRATHDRDRAALLQAAQVRAQQCVALVCVFVAVAVYCLHCAGVGAAVAHTGFVLAVEC
jgi:hypothetical protein